MQLSSEKDYNGNVNPIRNVIPKQKDGKNYEPSLTNKDNQSLKTGSKIDKFKNIATTTLKTSAKGAKGYFEIGAKMAEGNFNTKTSNPYNIGKTQKFGKSQTSEYIDSNTKKIGDNNEFNKES